jgi:hypothetical protein
VKPPPNHSASTTYGCGSVGFSLMLQTFPSAGPPIDGASAMRDIKQI